MTIASGLAAGVVSALAYGSFAVPIKSRAVLDAKVHPLIFQSYKSLICFLTSWLVLIYSPFGFTWWATLAALIWVNNGIMAIISIHLAGLGVVQTTWSAVSLFVSFAWGKLLFNEPIKNVPLSMTGLSLMVAGMLGLGYVASQAKAEEISTGKLEHSLTAEEQKHKGDQELEALERDLPPKGEDELEALNSTSEAMKNNFASADTQSAHVIGEDRPEAALLESPVTSKDSREHADSPVTSQEAGFSGWREQRRFLLGVLGGVYVGVCAGSMMVCLKMAPLDCKGDQYMVSFGIGVGLVTIAFLCLYAGACKLFGRQVPSFHVRRAAGPACLAGILWSLGNYLSILAVDSLGMAVGWPLVQCSLIVSNVWALFYYREVKGQKAILLFLASSCVILCGVILLACFGL